MTAPATQYQQQEGPAQPCVACGRPTTVIDRSTGQRHHIVVPDFIDCRYPDGMVPAAAPRTIPDSPGRSRTAPAAVLFTHREQQQAYRDRVAILDAMDPGDDSEEAIGAAAGALRIIEAMTDDPGGDKQKDGPFAPVKYGTTPPYWTARLPDIPPPLVAFAGWGTFCSETPYVGPAAVLDRNAGHPSAMSSLRVAHGQLKPTGPLPDASRPGYYKTRVHAWHRSELPSPMQNRAPGSEVWVTHERMRLLDQLANRGPAWWPEPTILDSYTADREVSLRDLSQLIRHLRVYVIDTYGKDSPQWEAIKQASNNKLIQILMGSPREAGAAARWTDRTWYTKCRRTDWGHALHDKAAMNLWRAADKLAGAGISVLSVRSMDEILIPEQHLAAALEQGLIKADETGRTFGTFKTKSREEWGS